MFGMYAWLYEQESQRISIRMKSALKTKAQNGCFKGSFAPYGYYVKEKEQECKTLIAEKFNINLLNELDGLKEKIIDLKELTPEVLNRFVERIEIKAYGTPRIFYRFSKLSIYFSDLTSNTQHSTWSV